MPAAFDPARMAISFAAVSPNPDGENGEIET